MLQFVAGSIAMALEVMRKLLHKTLVDFWRKEPIVLAAKDIL